MPDFLVFAGLALLTFVLGLLWFVAVSRDFFARYRRFILTLWGTTCAAIFVFLTTVDYLGLGNTVFGWITPVR